MLNAIGVSAFIAVGLGAIFITSLRFFAMIFSWRLPTWRV